MQKKALLFKPWLKSVIWGGDKICRYKKIPQTDANIGESWEISTMPGAESVVAQGEYEGMTLTQLIQRFGEELLGKKVIEKYGNRFPLLVKIIDAREDLSMQVHPDDSLALQRHGSLGKSEMWFVISADKGAKIYSGFKTRLNPEEYQARVENKTFVESIASHESHPGDVYYIPAGRVHAIGAGNLLAEIQEASDITYRIYDYERKDNEGKLRELHTELAKNALDFKMHDNYRTIIEEGTSPEVKLVESEHFTTHRLMVNTEYTFSTDNDSFRILICIKGEIEIVSQDGSIILPEGHTALIPASAGVITLKGSALVLSITV